MTSSQRKMPETIEVEVTPDDIANGVAYESGKCALALAIERACPGGVSVGTQEVTLKSLGVRVSLPLEARRFRADFDGERAAVLPFKFTLEVTR